MSAVDEVARYNGYVAARNNETSIRWQKVQIFFLINSVLLGAMVGTTLEFEFRIAICVFGLLATIVWWLMQWEAQSAIDYWNAEAARLEPKEENTHGFAFAKPREGFKLKFASTHSLILFLIDLFAISWIGLFLYYLLLAPKS